MSRVAGYATLNLVKAADNYHECDGVRVSWGPETNLEGQQGNYLGGPWVGFEIMGWPKIKKEVVV